MEKLIVFDVDGVLIDTEIGSFKEIGILLGKEKQVREHAEEYKRRKYLGPWGLDELGMIFQGIEEEKVVEAAKKVVEKQLMQGVKETMLKLKNNGFLIVSYSSSPKWIMEILKEKFGFVDTVCNILESKSGKLTGKYTKQVNRYVKAESLKKFLENKNIGRKNTFIVGDSVSDLPMAEYGRFIAFNSDSQQVKDKAEFIVDKKDLREILKLV